MYALSPSTLLYEILIERRIELEIDLLASFASIKVVIERGLSKRGDESHLADLHFFLLSFSLLPSHR